MDSIAIRSCTLICLMSAAFNAILRIVELILEPGYWFGIAIAQCANGEPLIRMAFLNKPEMSIYDLMKQIKKKFPGMFDSHMSNFI